MVKVLIDHPCPAIVAVLTEMDVEFSVPDQRQATTRALKQGMVQKSPTCRARRVDPHAAIP